MDVGYDILEFVKIGMWDMTYYNIYLKILNKQFDSQDFNISCKTLLLIHFWKKVNFSNFVGYDILERGYRYIHINIEHLLTFNFIVLQLLKNRQIRNFKSINTYMVIWGYQWTHFLFFYPQKTSHFDLFEGH